ncbi:MAG: dTDP-4-dehydrorhamnose reductase [Ignavibacteria bacterium GWB2_35_12]|nr:MAG: dTDP-4-dehydrorhamnose reductase [Ignavibacteria bacterium GWB2_35_12]OGU95387.1 MAG: dTDP-4-dehydrorhamnose reductase [Ignavibacteria bacterium RIFOXYA2_FULL_35_10]OGV24168.1 MAG: dTDP-4-dehydrorhamnose reductase [Ignavibacteria bacterium RIFOXYC2_FULL_35_21]
MKYLIIGSKGQLGNEFVKRLSLLNYNFIGVDIDELDITRRDDVIKFFRNVKPDVTINCAAFNLVDEAEENPEKAMAVNAGGTLNIALASKETKSFLIHYSSDYVFDGTKKDGLYIESDKTNPINKYGESKLKGEEILSDTLSDYLVFRLSWVFGEGTQNFIHKFIQWTKNSYELKIADDEISIPTYTYDIVDVSLKSLAQGLSGLFHLTNSGYTSRYGWAKHIADILKLNVNLIPVSKEVFNLPAKRPDFSAMDNNIISQEIGIVIPTWKESVINFLKSKST